MSMRVPVAFEVANWHLSHSVVHRILKHYALVSYHFVNIKLLHYSHR